MSSVVKNIIILIFFLVFYNTVVKADEPTGRYLKMFYRTIPDSWLVNTDYIQKCELRSWKSCMLS